MDTALKPDIGQIAKNPALQHGIHNLVVVFLVDINQPAQDNPCLFVPLIPLHLLPQHLQAFLGKILIGIQKQNPVPVRLLQCIIFCRRKIIDPLKMKHLRTGSLRQSHCIVLGACVHHNHFICHLRHAPQPPGQVLRLVLDNHTGRQS